MSYEGLDAHYIILAVLDTFLPLLIIIILQCLAYKALKHSVRRFGEDINRIRTIREVSKTFMVVTAVFFLLTTPYTVVELIVSYVVSKTSKNSEYNIDLLVDLLNTCLLIQTMNSCTNPLIYGKVHRWFLKLKCMGCCRQQCISLRHARPFSRGRTSSEQRSLLVRLTDFIGNKFGSRSTFRVSSSNQSVATLELHRTRNVSSENIKK